MKIFPTCYINVTVGLISGQMSVSHRQYFLIVFRSSLVINSIFPFLPVNSYHNPFDLLNALFLIVIPPSVYTAIGQSRIIKMSPNLRIEKKFLVNIGLQIWTSYGADIFLLYKIVIIIINFDFIIIFGSWNSFFSFRWNY